MSNQTEKYVFWWVSKFKAFMIKMILYLWQIVGIFTWLLGWDFYSKG